MSSQGAAEHQPAVQLEPLPVAEREASERSLVAGSRRGQVTVLLIGIYALRTHGDQPIGEEARSAI